MAKKKYSKALVKQICEHISNGLNTKDAVLLSGIVEETYYRWLKREDKDNPLNDEEYSYFCESVKKAEAIRKSFFLERIKAASYEQWQAAAWYLERRYPDEFAKKENAPVGDTPPFAPPQTEREVELAASLISRLEKYRKQKPDTSPTDISTT